MSIPQIDGTVSCSCEILPSEDPEKIRTALSHILPDSHVEMFGDSAEASGVMASLGHLFEIVASRRTQRAYARQMRHNMDDDSTWFLLNKQAACAGNIALCGDAEDSPLGPIRVTMRSRRLEALVEWLAGMEKI